MPMKCTAKSSSFSVTTLFGWLVHERFGADVSLLFPDLPLFFKKITLAKNSVTFLKSRGSSEKSKDTMMLQWEESLAQAVP